MVGNSSMEESRRLGFILEKQLGKTLTFLQIFLIHKLRRCVPVDRLATI
jgi:hypothetical protein